MSAKDNDKTAPSPNAEKFVPPEIRSNPAPGDDASARGTDGAEDLKKRLDEANARIAELEGQAAKLDEHKNDAARARADFYNYRARVERDRERDRVLAAERACDELLPVLDNLDRTLEAMSDRESPLCKGVSMVQRQFFAALRNLGLSLIDTSGEFDPKEHEAVMTVEVDDDAQDGKILEVLHRGYRLGDKVLRAACVKVGEKKKKQERRESWVKQ
jgi:molecular chaperone GrpE (heat shock protein)